MKVLIADDNPRLRITGMRLILTLGVVLAAFSSVLLDAAHAALRAPAAVAPRADARVEAPPAFKWRSVRGAVSYEFQLSADRRFSSRVLGRRNDSRFTANTYATADKALANGTYYWRVRAINARDHAGRWSRVRSFVMAWDTAPKLLGPIDGATVTWPAQPLVLNWTPVPGATKYSVTIATDPSMASPIIGTVRKPLKTQGTVLALPGSLAEGAYYWVVTPLNAGGHKGRRSRVGRFSWDWPSATNVRWSDLQADPRVFDPQFSWDPVPGAARYDVEINTSPDFAAGSKVCCRDATIGTSLSPTRVLANNVYYWRVRAVDSDGNAGQWNAGARIRKDFDPVGPGNPTTIPNLRLRTNELASAPAGATVSVPVAEWDPVPGASSYEVQVVPHEGPGCNWTAERSRSWRVVTAATAWTPLSPVWNGRTPSGISWPRAAKDSARLYDGTRYCVRVAARSDRDATNGNVVSDWTQLGGAGAVAFEYDAPDPPGPFGDPFSTPASSYLAPRAQHGMFARMPLFTWQPVAGAASYFVAVARDASFTELVDLAITQVPAYAPRAGGLDATTYPDESSDAGDTTVPATYYWAVFPATGGSGDGVSSYYSQNNPQTFQKRSAPPARVAPADGSDVSTQPTFRWTPTEGARQYRLQVAKDPNFRALIDDVSTASTAYTSSSTYPVDTALYWRVRATDENGLGMTWSVTGKFRRRLRVPAPRPENPLEGGTIPLLTWTPVEGAVSYDVHVDQADGRGKDFTYRSTAFSPTVFYGNGVWRWSVRANFPALTGRPAASGYFASLPFTRRVDAPTGARGSVTRKAMLLKWNPVDGAEEYRVEISRSNSFQRKVELIETQTTSWAPLMLRPDYRKPGLFYWRVTSIDAGNNLGGWRLGTVALGKALQIKVSGEARAGRRSRLGVTVVDHRNRRVRGAKVRVSGLGAKDTARTNHRGRTTLSFRAKRRGTITLIARKKGYARGEFSVQVR